MQALNILRRGIVIPVTKARSANVVKSRLITSN